MDTGTSNGVTEPTEEELSMARSAVSLALRDIGAEQGKPPEKVEEIAGRVMDGTYDDRLGSVVVEMRKLAQ